MASSSSSSNTASGKRPHAGRRVSQLRQLSREDKYKGNMRYCFCRLRVPRWTAWMKGNSGRKFYGCRNYCKDDGCGYFAWHDNESDERANTVITELLDDIDGLYDENNMLRRVKDGRRFIEEVDAIHEEVRNLNYRHEKNNIQLR